MTHYWIYLTAVACGIGIFFGWTAYKSWVKQDQLLAFVSVQIVNVAGCAFGTFEFSSNRTAFAIIILASTALTFWWFFDGRNQWRKLMNTTDRFLRELLDDVREFLAPPVWIPALAPVRN